MNKDNILYSIIGLLLGFIVGFFFANSVNQRALQSSPQGQQSQSGSLPPDHPPVAANQGQSAQSMEQVQQIVQAARNSPGDFDAQMRAAEMFYRIQRHDDAIEFLMRANQLRPDSYEVMIALGNANFEARHWELAEKWYAAALARNPNDVNVRTDLGLTFFFREPKDIERAIREYRGSLERDPNHELTLQNFSVALLEKGDKKEARSMIERLERVNPANAALERLKSDLAALESGAKKPAGQK